MPNPRKSGLSSTEPESGTSGKGEAFGVWVAHLNGEDYEIATLREDGSGGDGRRPDQVYYTTDLAKDHGRRDLTMNALYYDIPEDPSQPGTIIDHGTGIQDIRDQRVRVIGDPYARFGEDRLRISRLPRFHSRWNDGDIGDILDQRTKDAVAHYKDLRGPSKYFTPEGGAAHDLGPVSGERIQQEFLSGVLKAKNCYSFIKNYETLGLLPAVFPGLDVDVDSAQHLNGESAKNPTVVLAQLLRRNDPKTVRSQLNKLKWPSEIADEVAFLVDSWRGVPNADPQTMVRHVGDLMKKARSSGPRQHLRSRCSGTEHAGVEALRRIPTTCDLWRRDSTTIRDQTGS
jgi:tRNA nucleotidyltransferase/poly(A) polymerase